MQGKKHMLNTKAARAAIHSNASLYIIQQQTGIQYTSLRRLRNGDSQLQNVSFRTVDALDTWWKKNKTKYYTTED